MERLIHPVKISMSDTLKKEGQDPFATRSNVTLFEKDQLFELGGPLCPTQVVLGTISRALLFLVHVKQM